MKAILPYLAVSYNPKPEHHAHHFLFCLESNSALGIAPPASFIKSFPLFQV